IARQRAAVGALEETSRHARRHHDDSDRDQRDGDRADVGAAAAHVRCAFPASAGNVRMNRVPVPGVLSTWMVPPLSSMMRWTNDTPSHEPARARAFVGNTA